MKCPICKKEVALGDAEFPFCSERCRTIDLGNWASGKYVISAPLRPDRPDTNTVAETDDDE
ncbi:MAG: DNA gyrase inhibitor YacG [Bryobacteraceae bacterium]